MKYSALVSSDWNECLAPCGPFDPISFAFPDLATDLAGILRQYTGNEISLTEATRRTFDLMPTPVSQEQMDSYLDASFATYRGVPELIEWCLSQDILFMINTTGMQGYFQRVFAKKLLPRIPVVAANPMIRFARVDDDPCYAFAVTEIEDKPKNTKAVMRAHDIHPSRVIVIGDSGGDGPHFEWAAAKGAFRIGSMTKPSLHEYCQPRGISIQKRFGISYGPGEPRRPDDELFVKFTDLTLLIQAVLDLREVEGAISALERSAGLIDRRNRKKQQSLLHPYCCDKSND